MNIAIGSDHAGFALKEKIKAHFKTYHLYDCGTFSEDPVDYPDIAVDVSNKIINEDCKKGILICGSGVGAAIAANKIKGIRASVCHDTYSAHQGVEHDDMNILTLGARVIGENLAKDIVREFLEAKFLDTGRYKRRLDKVKALEG